jgi:hypothetical protein
MFGRSEYLKRRNALSGGRLEKGKFCNVLHSLKSEYPGHPATQEPAYKRGTGPYSLTKTQQSC